MAEQTIKKTKNRLSSDVVWYQSILNRYNSVNAASNAIDTKTSVIIAGTIAVVIFVASLGESMNVYHIVGLLCVITSLIIALVAIHVRDLHTEVQTTQEKPEYYELNDREFTWQLIADLEASLVKAEEKNKTKAKLYIFILYFFLAGGLSISIGQVAQNNLNHGETSTWQHNKFHQGE